MDALGRFYTSNIISNLLISNLETKSPEKILDLGLGDASLSIAAYSRWDSASFFGTEIEKRQADKIKKNLSFISVFNYDTLKPNVSNKLKIKFGEIDIAICNPPYIKVEDKQKYKKLFDKIGCKDFNNLKRVTSEVVFFAHNLNMLRKGGELAIIVSDSLITGKDYKLFRESILKNYSVRMIIQLPDKVFRKTEARTHIIFLSKSESTDNKCKLFMSTNEGFLTPAIEVEKIDLYSRMDYNFHSKYKKNVNYPTLREIGAHISRGKLTYKELKTNHRQYFHTTDFKHNDKYLFLEPTIIKNDKSIASEGDILMGRVGKRVVGKAALIKFGQTKYSDCIYKISVPLEHQQRVFDSLLSTQGKNWLEIYSHGVCSQVISKSDLLDFPIFNFSN